jgi:hypothetical protein
VVAALRRTGCDAAEGLHLAVPVEPDGADALAVGAPTHTVGAPTDTVGAPTDTVGDGTAVTSAAGVP